MFPDNKTTYWVNNICLVIRLNLRVNLFRASLQILNENNTQEIRIKQITTLCFKN